MRQVSLCWLATHGLKLPLRADVALYAAGFWPLPAHGPVSRDGNIVRYDEAWPGWEIDVWSIVCARVLADAGYPDGPWFRAELARAFGVELHAARDASAC